ncbi:MAG: Gfo/Idh/MocA family oxidoreductase [Candidatus Brocadiia bacterium]
MHGTAMHDPIGVGAAGVRPGEQTSALEQMPVGPTYKWVAFSDEGTHQGQPEHRPVTYYPDYNMLLKDPEVEMVLVDGPVELRRDLAVRALNAGRHVVLALPFCETALDAERVMKTALHTGLVATAELPWRTRPELLSLRHALEQENVSKVVGVHGFWSPGDDEEEQTAEPGEPDDLLERHGFALLDQLNLVADRDIKDVTAHVIRAGPGRAAEGFLLYLNLRQGGWAIAQMDRRRLQGAPAWLVRAGSSVLTTTGGQTVVTADGKRRDYGLPQRAEGFWQDLYEAVRHGAEPRCHPVQIVRAMKLHEAAEISAEEGRAVTL